MELKQYLDKYKNLKPPHESEIKLLIQTIHDECGISLSEKEISVRRGGAIISCHPTVRSELLQFAPQVINTLLKKHNIRIAFIR